jgi:hypothetical protein
MDMSTSLSLADILHEALLFQNSADQFSEKRVQKCPICESASHAAIG